MPQFVIKRNLSGAGDLSRDKLVAISPRSCDVLRIMDPEIQCSTPKSEAMGSTASTSLRTSNTFASSQPKANTPPT